MLVFDVTSKESYDNLDIWRKNFVNTTGDSSSEIPIILVGNKMDKGSVITREKVMVEWIRT